MNDQNRRDDGTPTRPGEQIRPKRGGKEQEALGSGRAGGCLTEDDLAKRADRDGASDEGTE